MSRSTPNDLPDKRDQQFHHHYGFVITGNLNERRPVYGNHVCSPPTGYMADVNRILPTTLKLKEGTAPRQAFKKTLSLPTSLPHELLKIEKKKNRPPDDQIGKEKKQPPLR